MKKKKYSDLDDLRSESALVTKAISTESDRGYALITAAFFDATLTRILLAQFDATGHKRPKLIDPLFEGFGPLSSFSSKIGVCYAFNLIGEVATTALHLVRKIRNDFAHSLVEKSFLDPTISALVDRLWELAGSDESIADLTQGMDPLTTQKIKFNNATGWLAGILQASVIVMGSEQMTAEMKAKFASALGKRNKDTAAAKISGLDNIPLQLSKHKKSRR